MNKKIGISQQELEQRLAKLQEQLKAVAAAIAGKARVTRYRVKAHRVRAYTIREYWAIRISVPQARK